MAFITATKDLFRRTQRVVLCNSLTNEPLASLYGWLPFILRKDLSASLLQLAVLSSLKPILALISFYLTSSWKSSLGFLRGNLLLTGIGTRLPFFLFPFVSNVWFLVLASSLYTLFSRAGIPAWMEVLKRNLDKEHREKIFSWGSVLGYAEGCLLALGVGFLLDQDPRLWKWLFFFAACIGLLGVWLQMRLPIRDNPAMEEAPKPLSFVSFFVKPWKDTFSLMKENRDFALFQWAFMAGGFGVMLMINVVPLYFADSLNMSYANFTTAKSICMGLGFIATTPFWTKALKKMPLNLLTCVVCCSFALFPFFLFFSKFSLAWVYIAYAFYGFSQGGSHLVWHLSGPIFAGEQDSARYSGVNLVMVGIRGVIAPALGNTLYGLFGAEIVLALGLLLCLFGGGAVATRVAARKV